MQKDYKWLDGYVFLHSKKSWLALCGQWSERAVRYVGRLEPDDGPDPDRIVVFVEADRTAPNAAQELATKMEAVKGTANPSCTWATAIDIGPNGPTRWSTKKQWGAFLRIKAAPGQAQSLFASLHPDGSGGQVPAAAYHGHALCNGHWDVLLELGADSKAALDPLIASVSSMPGVASVIVNKQKNFVAMPEPPARGTCKDWLDD